MCALAGTDRHVTGRLAPEAGSRLGNLTDPDQPSRYSKVSMRAGAYGPYGDNDVCAGTNSYAVPEPRLATYRVSRGVLLALAETFEVTQAYAWSSDLSKLAEGRGGLQGGLPRLDRLHRTALRAPGHATARRRRRAPARRRPAAGGDQRDLRHHQPGPSRSRPRHGGGARAFQRRALAGGVREMIATSTT